MEGKEEAETKKTVLDSRELMMHVTVTSCFYCLRKVILMSELYVFNTVVLYICCALGFNKTNNLEHTGGAVTIHFGVLI